MKTLPNGLTVFNATPHVIRFWDESWGKPIEVGVDVIINAVIDEEVIGEEFTETNNRIEFVTPSFLAESGDVIDLLQSLRDNGVYVIGSILAAQAYPGLVFAMVPCAGYERVSPVEKRMRPDKFTLFYD